MSTWFVAIMNTPGYLPQDDDPPVFDTPAEAWGYLANERERDLTDATDGDAQLDTTWSELRRLATLGPQAPFGHSVVGSTPGYDGSHDLGLAYTVMVTDEPPNEG